MSVEDLGLMRLEIQWEQCCGAQGLFGTVQMWLVWIVFSVLQRVWGWIWEKGVFVAALIKKPRYWPANFKGDAINAHFALKEVGNVDAVKQVEDRVVYHVFFMTNTQGEIANVKNERQIFLDVLA